MNSVSVSRRAILSASAGAMFFASTATAAPKTAEEHGWSGSRSANGWRIGAPTAEHQIEGTNFTVTLATGAPAIVLLHAARRINYELDTLRVGDIVGLSTDRMSVESPQRSNRLSGTAIHFRPGSFPRGQGNNLFPEEIAVLEDIVAESAGVLAWGGHLTVPDEGLVYITRGPSPTGSEARRIETVDRIDSSRGAGAVDPHDRRGGQVRRKSRAGQG